MIIAIDCDSVLCMLQERCIEIFNERHGTSYNMSDFTDYNVSNCLPVQEAIEFKNLYGESGLYATVKPLPGAQKGIQRLLNGGHEIFIVTDAIPATYAEKIAFLKHYFQINDDHIVAMKHKELFRCDVMVEDNLQTLLAKPYYERVLIDAPWNQESMLQDETYGVYRCYNWDDIVDAIEKINVCYKE